LEKNKDFLIN